MSNIGTTIEVPDNFYDMLVEDAGGVLDGARSILGLPPRPEKLTTLDSLQLVTSFGYDILPHAVVRMIDRGELPCPARFGIELAWTNADICSLMLILDEKRKWLPGFHKSRKTNRELARDEREAGAAMKMISFLETLSGDELIQRLDESHEPKMQMLIRHTLREKLASATESEPV